MAAPTPTFVPIDGEPRRRTSLGASTTGDTVLLEDSDWTGGYRSSRGSNNYGGRSAIWVYGTATTFSEMRASFTLQGVPTGSAELSVEAMDSEDAAKTPILITINGRELYRGPSPFANDDLPLDSGTWETQVWRFDSAWLRSGENVLAINNTAVGAFSRPPFLVLDYAEVTYQERN